MLFGLLVFILFLTNLSYNAITYRIKEMSILFKVISEYCKICEILNTSFVMTIDLYSILMYKCVAFSVEYTNVYFFPI